MGGDYLLAPSRGNRPDNRIIVVIRIRINENILKFLFGQELGHCLCEHGFAGTGAPDHHDMPALDSCLLDDLDRVFLADDLVDKFCRYLDLGGYRYHARAGCGSGGGPVRLHFVLTR